MIDSWLERFRSAWENKDLEAMAKLFSEDVDYWETPFKFIKGINKVIEEWQAIKEQRNIKITTDVLISSEEKYTVQWKLEYMAAENEKMVWSGIYLIQLNHKGICDYFYQVGEKQ